MKRIKCWLFEALLPDWCREELLTENKRLRIELAEARQKLGQQRAYIDGMTAALRQQRKISISNEVKR